MSQQNHETEVVPVHRVSLWLAALGFLALAIGAIGVGWFPTVDRLNFVLQALGPALIAVALLIEWRTNVERRGWASFILFLIAILTFGALWIPYVVDPTNLGTASATQLGFLMSGIAAISASLGTFAVMARKESQLNQPVNTGEPLIKATFMQLLLFGVGMLIYGVDLIWVGEEESNHAQFSLLALALLIVMVAVFSFRAHLSLQIGTPAVAFTIVAIAFYALGFVLHSLPSFMNEEWRLLQGLQGIAYVFAAVACASAAIHKTSASKS
jgi:hypothetical protein